MALTVIKYRKAASSNNAMQTFLVQNKPQVLQQLVKRPIIKLEGNPGFIFDKLLIKPDIKRPGDAAILNETIQKTPKYAIQLGEAISSLPPTTIIKATSRSMQTSSNETQFTTQESNNTLSSSGMVGSSSNTNSVPVTNAQMRPTTVFIKREPIKRTRNATLEMIENNPFLHLGINIEYLPIIKRTICPTADVSHVDCYITLRKLRLNEPFALLSEYFEFTEIELEQIFTRTLPKLARFLRFLIRWPDSKHHYERHKYLPFAYRAQLSHVQSMIECVETEVDSALNVGFPSYKFIYCINTNGIISYISESYRGDCDDLMLFEACNFQSAIPEYLSLVSEPGKAITRRSTSNDAATELKDLGTDANPLDVDVEPLSKYDAQRIAGELASSESLRIVDGQLTSSHANQLSIPVVQLRNSICRDQIRDSIDTLREFRVLQPCGIQQHLLFEYLNEILIVAAAIINLQR